MVRRTCCLTPTPGLHRLSSWVVLLLAAGLGVAGGSSCSTTTETTTGCSTDPCESVATCGAGYVVLCANSPGLVGDGIVPSTTTCTSYTGNAGVTVTPTATCETGCTTSTVVSSDSLFKQETQLTASCTGGAVALKCFCYSPWGGCGQNQEFDPDSGGTSCSLYIPQVSILRRRESTERRRNGAKIYAICQVPQPTGAPSSAPTSSPTFTPTGAPSSAPSYAPSAAPTTYPTEEGETMVTVEITQTVVFNATLSVAQESEVKIAYKATLTDRGLDGSLFAVSLVQDARRASVSYTITALGQAQSSVTVVATCGSSAFASTLSGNTPSELSITVDPCTTDENTGSNTTTGAPSPGPTVSPSRDEEQGFFDDPVFAWGIISGGVASLLAIGYISILLVRKCKEAKDAGWFSKKRRKKGGWFTSADGDTNDLWKSNPKLQKKMMLAMMGGDKLTADDRAALALEKLARKTRKSRRDGDFKHPKDRHHDRPSAASRWKKVARGSSRQAKRRDKDLRDKEQTKSSHYERWKNAAKKSAKVAPEDIYHNISPKSRSRYLKIRPLGLELQLDDVPLLTRPEVKQLVVMDGKKKAFQKLALTWHPDKFGQKYGHMLDQSHAREILERVEHTFQMIQEVTRHETPSARSPMNSTFVSPTSNPGNTSTDLEMEDLPTARDSSQRFRDCVDPLENVDSVPGSLDPMQFQDNPLLFPDDEPSPERQRRLRRGASQD